MLAGCRRGAIARSQGTHPPKLAAGQLGDAPMNVLPKLASEAATKINDAIPQACTPQQLQQLACLIWQGNGEGVINDDDANYLQEHIVRRRGTQGFKARTMGARPNRFAPSRRPSSPDREASRPPRRILA